MKRKITVNFIIFYMLFSPDTWQVLMGILISSLLTPHVVPEDVGTSGRVMIYIMVATIGYAATSIPGKWISELFKRLILGGKRPR